MAYYATIYFCYSSHLENVVFELIKFAFIIKLVIVSTRSKQITKIWNSGLSVFWTVEKFD